MNELETRVVRFHAEPGFFAGEKSPLQARESTGDAGYYTSGCADYLSDAGYYTSDHAGYYTSDHAGYYTSFGTGYYNIIRC